MTDPDLDRIFKAYDVRGVVPDDLDANIARRIGAAFAVWTKLPAILLGRDSRISSPELAAAITEGATSVGVDVVDLGLASTDLVYFASGSLDLPAVMLTASHNPKNYDGTFPNHPADPLDPENQKDLKATVLEHDADVGLAFDGDADRVFLVDEKAEDVSGSLLTALVARAMLRQEPGAKIVHNLICSWIVPESIRAEGGVPIRTRVGHSFIKQVMAETGAIFGGEHSGHYYFRKNYRADSGLIAAVVALGELSSADAPLSDVLAPFRKYFDSGEINSPVDDPLARIERIAVALADGRQDRLDGLTVEYPDWWCNVRPSNTEPLLRLNVEATTAELLARKTATMLDLIRS